MEGKDKLVDGFRQIDSTNTVGTDEIAHNDTINHIPQTARERYEYIGPEEIIELFI